MLIGDFELEPEALELDPLLEELLLELEPPHPARKAALAATAAALRSQVLRDLVIWTLLLPAMVTSMCRQRTECALSPWVA